MRRGAIRSPSTSEGSCAHHSASIAPSAMRFGKREQVAISFGRWRVRIIARFMRNSFRPVGLSVRFSYAGGPLLRARVRIPVAPKSDVL